MAAWIWALVGRFVTSTYRPDALFSFAFPLCFNDFRFTALCCQWHRIRSRAIGMLSNCLVLLRSTSMEFYQTRRIFSTRIIEISYRIRIPTVAVYSTRTERGLLQRCFVGISFARSIQIFTSRRTARQAHRTSRLFVAIFPNNWQRERRKEGGKEGGHTANDWADDRDESKQRKRRTRGL